MERRVMGDGNGEGVGESRRFGGSELEGTVEILAWEKEMWCGLGLLCDLMVRDVEVVVKTCEEL